MEREKIKAIAEKVDEECGSINGPGSEWLDTFCDELEALASPAQVELPGDWEEWIEAERFDAYDYSPDSDQAFHGQAVLVEALRARLKGQGPVAEPEAWLFQHEETGQTHIVEHQQVEWGFEKANPRLQKICPLYRHPAPTNQSAPVPSVPDYIKGDRLPREGEATLSAPAPEDGWRRLLWLRHGCEITALYGDDGEMQCGQCGIDFLRESPNEIEQRWREINRDAFVDALTASTPSPKRDDTPLVGVDRVPSDMVLVPREPSPGQISQFRALLWCWGGKFKNVTMEQSDELLKKAVGILAARTEAKGGSDE